MGQIAFLEKWGPEVVSSSRRILVVEDDATLGQVIRFKLSRAGFDVIVAHNGSEALDLLGASKFDLVVTDEIMPVMTGRQLCEQMQQNATLRRIPIVMLTVKALELDAAELQSSLGVIEVHPKPFSPTLLLRTIERVLSREAAECFETAAR